MLKPLFIDNDYQLRDSASGQIARVFWEQQNESEFQPTIVCTPSNFKFKSKWKTIEVKDRYKIWYLGVGFRKIGLPGLSLLPDMNYYSWAKFVLFRLHSQLSNLDFDYIHTLCAPRSTHLIGLDLKKRTGKPWIAQFNDPWYDNPNNVKQSKLVGLYNLRREREVAENADIIIHTNHIIAEIWEKRYGSIVKDKMFVVPLNYNINPLPEIINTDYIDYLNVAHLGSIYSSRSSLDFLKGLAMLLQKYPDFRKKIHVTFVGGLKKEEVGAADKLGVGDVVEYVSRIAPEELSKFYSNANLFLAIDVNLNSSPCFPSKLIMYHYYKKPIIGITNHGSVMEQELLKTGNNICYYGHPEQVADYLYRAITNYNSLNTFDKDYWKRFTVENVASVYISKVNLLIKNENVI